MATSQDLKFDHDDRKDIYEYLERNGAADADSVRDDLGIDPRGFRHHVAILKRDGYVEEVDDRLRVTIEAGEEEEFHDQAVDFTIRPAREADLTGLVGAIRQVAEDKTYIEAEEVADVIDHEDMLLRHDEIESRMFFVACVNDEVVGWVHLRAPELEKLSHTAELTVGVLEEYRGHGIGGHLLQRGLEWAASNGKERIYQSVPATNEEAISFLEAHGWETEAVRSDHYLLDGEYIDEVMMEVSLE